MAPFAIRGFLTLFGEQVEIHKICSTDEPESSPAPRALIASGDRPAATPTRGVTSPALRVYKEETARLTAEVAAYRSELSLPNGSGTSRRST